MPRDLQRFMLYALLQPEEARKQIVLVVDGPACGKSKVFPQPQHRLETSDGSPSRVEGLEGTDLWHVLLNSEIVTLDALLEVLGDVVDGIGMEKPIFNCSAPGLPETPTREK